MSRVLKAVEMLAARTASVVDFVVRIKSALRKKQNTSELWSKDNSNVPSWLSVLRLVLGAAWLLVARPGSAHSTHVGSHLHSRLYLVCD